MREYDFEIRRGETFEKEFYIETPEGKHIDLNDKSGIFGYNIGWMNPRDGENEGEIYFNGTVRQIQGSISYAYRNGPLFGNNNSSWGNLGSFSIQAGAFYNRWLTEAEMLYIYDQLAAL